MALPVFGEFMKRYTASPAYKRWNTLAFPLPVRENDALAAPAFREHLNMIERLTNRKLEKTKPSLEQETLAPEPTPRKEGFFKRLFKRKKEKK